EALITEGEEVVVVAADVTSLDADAGVVEGFELGEGLGEETGLNLLGDLEFLGGAAIGLNLFCGDSPLLLDLAGELVGTDKLEAVSIDVLKAGEGYAEDGLLGWLVKAHALLVPEFIGGVDVFRDEADLGVAADEAVFVGAGFGRDKG